MAPRKEKTEKASADQGADMVLKYLKQQNRPYSAIDVSANLHNKVTKSAAAKYLKELHEKQEIAGCASGKQLVYHAIQDPNIDATPETLAAMSSSLAELRTQTTSLESEIKTLKTQLNALSNMRSTAELQDAIDDLTTKKVELVNRLEPLRQGTVKKVDAEEKNAVDKELEKWVGIEARRKKIAREMWGVVTDMIPEDKNVSDVREELGLDDD